MPDVIASILGRVSSPRLCEPAPSADHVRQILQCAVQAPDHGRLKPWQFIVVSGAGLQRLGQIFVDAKRAEVGPDLDEKTAEKLLSMPSRAPMIVIACAKVTIGHKVPEQEQFLAVGAAVQNMQLAARELGYGAMWRTGEMSEHAFVKAALGLKDADGIVAFLYLGTKATEDRISTEGDIENCVEYWD